ncbi:MAG TPA: YebC/PmpR family DNA-binding transcriptional regulator [Candidatus Bathyarchaeia archaeon]|nr:YebC/PmpR family DNA-binding transcriptional regulator [Candidatus Bathyarchaeia archaeon]
MSGHSHWAGIKHKKGLADAKRAGVFTKVARIVTLAAKEGGGNPDMNFKLRIAIDQARAVNMPKDNIDRAVKRGTGELKDAAQIEEIVYEALAPGNIAMLVKTATDNKNRTVSELKAIFNKTNVKMVPAGSFKHLFKQVGVIYVDTTDKDADDLEMKAIEAGAIDTIFQAELLQIYTEPRELKKVKDALEKSGVEIDNANIIFHPLDPIEIDQDTKIDYETLLEKLDELDDVQEIYDNL